MPKWRSVFRGGRWEEGRCREAEVCLGVGDGKRIPGSCREGEVCLGVGDGKRVDAERERYV